MKTLEQYKWICPEPFVGVNIATTGKFRPCCYMSSNEVDLALNRAEQYNIEKNSYKQFYYSDFMARLRSSMKNENDFDFLYDACSICKFQEDSGNMSQRQFYLKQFNKKLKHKKVELEKIIDENLYPTFIRTSELDGLGGNYCNLSCSMCHEYSSSGVLKEKIELKEPTVAPIKFVKEKPSPLIKVTPCKEFMDELPDILNISEELKLVGGEPLLNKETYQLIDLIENPQEKFLRVTTNGTINPDRFIKKAKEFKSVEVCISIEGVGAVNDYIRYPSKWKDILTTYYTFKKTTNFSVNFVTTINALNISRLYQISEIFPSKSFSFAIYIYNNEYSLRSIPPDLKVNFIEALYKKSNLPQVKNLIPYLENSIYSEEEMISMIKHIKRRDKLRNTNLLEVFPEWKPYYDSIEI
jgi:organic radical activating enzyme